jgi:riboflavin synthase
MFTGIVEAVGTVRALHLNGGDARIEIDAGKLDMRDVAEGDSIAVAGCCLTALGPNATGFAADVSGETLSLTTLGAFAPGTAVNLEKALRLSDRLSGHLLSGHIDGVGKVVSVTPDARSQRWLFEAPVALARYIAAKGSIAIDGVSLTVNEVDGTRFGVNLIPHTLAHTTFGLRRAGDAVNLEADMMARYAERLLGAPGD